MLLVLFILLKINCVVLIVGVLKVVKGLDRLLLDLIRILVLVIFWLVKVGVVVIVVFMVNVVILVVSFFIGFFFLSFVRIVGLDMLIYLVD